MLIKQKLFPLFFLITFLISNINVKAKNLDTNNAGSLTTTQSSSYFRNNITLDQYTKFWAQSQESLTPSLVTANTPYVYHWGNLNNKPKAIIFCIHGLTIHGYAYRGIGNFLASHDYLVICADQHGFGRFYNNLDKNLQDPKLEYYDVLNDFEILVKKIRKLYPSTKLFCMGESTGGHLSLRFGCKHPDLVDGLIISSASMKTKIPKPSLLFGTGSQILRHPFGQINLTKFIGQTMSEDPKTVAERMNDPLGRNYLSIEEISKYLWLSARTKPFVNKIPAQLPVLILQGEIDSIYAPQGSIEIAKLLKSKDKTLKLLPNSGHVLLETKYIKPQTAQTVLTWLNKHCQAATSDTSLSLGDQHGKTND